MVWISVEVELKHVEDERSGSGMIFLSWKNNYVVVGWEIIVVSNCKLSWENIETRTDLSWIGVAKTIQHIYVCAESSF